MNLLANAIYVPIETYKDEVPFSNAHRIVGIDRINGVISLFSMGDNSRAPFNFSLVEFEQLVAEKKLQKGLFATPGYMLRSEFSNRDRAILDERIKLVKPFMDKKDDRWVFDFELRARLINQQMKQFNRPRKTILRWLYHYIKHGMVPGALSCGFSRRGGFGKKKTAGDIKRGRPRNAVITEHDVSQTGINITEEIRKAFRLFKDIYYSIKDGRGLGFVLDRVIDVYFSDVVISENGDKKYIPHKNIPTRRQLDYWHKNDGDSIGELEKREGTRRFKLNNRALGGRAAQDCIGPTDKFELDSTVIDIYCVSAYNRSWIIGRPVLYFLVDTYSRMIVGFHLALSGPNWDEARVALFNAFTDKVAFCEKAGILISYEDWPCHHLPITVLVDRGEMRAHKPQGLKEGLGIEIDLAPSFRGDFKSIVERRFRIINDLVIKWLPGAVKARGIERGERDYRLDATFTMEEIKKVIIKCILHHNQHTEYPDLLTRQMVNDGIAPTPISIWNWGLENEMGSPRQESPRNVYCHLLPKAFATVKADGIWWNGVRYTCETEIANNWRARARNKESWRQEIRYVPDSTDHIYIFDEREGSFEQCDILAPDERYKGIRVDECTDARAYLKLEASDRNPKHSAAKSDFDSYFEKLLKMAKALTNPSKKGLSKQEQLADINIKRQLEILISTHPSLKNNTKKLLELAASQEPDEMDEDDQARRNMYVQLQSSVQDDTSI